KLAQIREVLSTESGGMTINKGGFGLPNVNKRIKLYYGNQYGLSIQSQYRAGTQVTVTIPESNETI
ncbi:MAG: sensor histidine kinase, partial [Candidatus Promineifilaceae bacterium]